MSDNKKTILVCDDNADILEVVTKMLRSSGYTVFSANGYKDFLPQVESVKPDLLICDIRMPEHDGFWIAEHLQVEGVHIPIIFITAHDTNLYRAYAPFVGSVGYITKPFEESELISQVESALATSAAKAAGNVKKGSASAQAQ